ncbi:hypothetical protein HK405_011412 [Cladochytrium tenue]|nr:hypothetical protein HK405_011412 [Cladochytrium tenue]
MFNPTLPSPWPVAPSSSSPRPASPTILPDLLDPTPPQAADAAAQWADGGVDNAAIDTPLCLDLEDPSLAAVASPAGLADGPGSVFGFGSFEAAFVTEEDLERARKKLLEENVLAHPSVAVEQARIETDRSETPKTPRQVTVASRTSPAWNHGPESGSPARRGLAFAGLGTPTRCRDTVSDVQLATVDAAAVRVQAEVEKLASAEAVLAKERAAELVRVGQLFDARLAALRDAHAAAVAAIRSFELAAVPPADCRICYDGREDSRTNRASNRAVTACAAPALASSSPTPTPHVAAARGIGARFRL